MILALAGGGCPVAAEGANFLDAPLDLLLVGRIGVLWQPQPAMGTAIDGSKPRVVHEEEIIRPAGTAGAEFDAIC